MRFLYQCAFGAQGKGNIAASNYQQFVPDFYIQHLH